MKKEEYFLPARHAIVETDINTINKTKERLLAFQLTQKDFDLVKKEFQETISSKDILKKHESLLERTNFNTKEEKEVILKNFEEYIESLTTIDINPTFFGLRKEVGKSYNEANLDDDHHLSSHIRILEIAVPEIIKKYSHNTEKTSQIILSLIKTSMFDYRLTSKFKNELNGLEIIKNINEIMNSVMEVNKTNELLNSIDNTTEQTDNVASATEELSASVTNILGTIKNVSMNMNKLLDDISAGQTQIEASLNDMVQLKTGFTKTKGNINDLVSDIRDISTIIELIKTVSEQTTLLAINASIEASRAGENGKGFSVIADEIRTLSEKTTESVESITKVIKSVEDDTRKVDRNTEELFEELKEKTINSKKSISTLEEITKQTLEVGYFTKVISDILDEQYVSTQKIKNFLDDVVKNSSNVKALAKHTGLSIYNVSKQIEDLRVKTIRLIPDLRHRHFLNIVKTEEKLQQWWIYNSLLGFHHFPSIEEINETENRFWTWYSKAKNNPTLSTNYSFKKLEDKHLELYHLEEKVRYLILKGKNKEAISLLDELTKKTNEISHLIEIIETELN